MVGTITLWLPVPEWDRYEINKYGDVRVSATKDLLEPTEVSTWRNGTGYCYVTLAQDGRRKHARVHILVATTFLSEQYRKGLIVDHIDRNKSNNHVDNLRWVTYGENNANKEGGRTHVSGQSLISRFNEDHPHKVGRKERRNAYNYILKYMDRYDMTYEQAREKRKAYEKGKAS